MEKEFTGYCPTLDKTVTIHPGYERSRRLSAEPNAYDMLIMHPFCDHLLNGGKCDSECPILAKAPETIYI